MANIISYYEKIRPFAINYYHALIIYINSLTQQEIIIILIIAAILVLVIAYRLFGIGMVVGIILVYALAYILYTSNVIGFYNNQTSTENQHLNTIQEEINK